MEESEKQKELEKWLNDDRYVQAKELRDIWNLSQSATSARLRKHKINPVMRISRGTRGFCVLYSRLQCIGILTHADKIANMEKNVKLISSKKLCEICTTNKLKTLQILYIKQVKNKYLLPIECRKGTIAFYDRQSALTALADKLKPEYRHLLTKEPTMQTADFIPADTLDIYNLNQLKAKIPGIEAHYELFNKSEIPEYQEIARMLRGNQKSVNLWGKMVEGIQKDVSVGNEIAPEREFKETFDIEDVKNYLANKTHINPKDVDFLASHKFFTSAAVSKILGIGQTLVPFYHRTGKIPAAFVGVLKNGNNLYLWTDKEIDMLKNQIKTKASVLLPTKQDKISALELRVAELEKFIATLRNNLQSLSK